MINKPQGDSRMSDFVTRCMTSESGVRVKAQLILCDPPGENRLSNKTKLTDFFFSHSGNIVLKPGSSSKILERDIFTQEDCDLSANVMVESADAYAAIVVWTPEQSGFASGKKEKRKASMSGMWQTALEGSWKMTDIQDYTSEQLFFFSEP